MATIKVILRNKANTDGTHSLALQVLKDRRQSITHIGHSIDPKFWDAAERRVKKSHPNSQRLNALILKKLAEAEEKLLELEADKKDTNAHTIKRTIKGKSDATFFPQAQDYLDNLTKEGKFNRLSAEEPRINRFKEFLRQQDIAFKEITVPLLNKYRAYLKGTRNIAERTIVNHLIVLRSIFNQAIKGHKVDPKYYPFGSNKIHIKFPDSIKIGLTSDEVRMLEEVQLPDPKQQHARNLWLFSFYLAGMRVSDVLRLTWSEMQDGRLYYAMGKNGKVGSLKLPTKALQILEHYQKQKDDTDLVFPDLKKLPDLTDKYTMQRYTKTRVGAINSALQGVKDAAGITKTLTMHIPRHSFGNISGDKIPVQMLQKLYRHTSITTTIGYQANFIHSDVDNALEAVIGNN